MRVAAAFNEDDSVRVYQPNGPWWMWGQYLPLVAGGLLFVFLGAGRIVRGVFRSASGQDPALGNDESQKRGDHRSWAVGGRGGLLDATASGEAMER